MGQKEVFAVEFAVSVKKAKDMIKESVTCYLRRDGEGRFLIPVKEQMPLELVGPPGVGKTEIVEQTAGELGIGFVSVSIAHHVRQTALGLPEIVEIPWAGKTCKTTRYTMSEILAPVYEAYEAGQKEGILLVDEFNTASDSLMPAMLGFLQFKALGAHRLPEGWLLVLCGNPKQYNRHAREFTAAIRDRIRRICIEPDLEAFLEYGMERGLHPDILSFLKTTPDCFYRCEDLGDREVIVTPRDWYNLSGVLAAYEEQGFAVTAELVAQFIKDEQTTVAFVNHYRTYSRLFGTGDVERILAGNDLEVLAGKYGKADFDVKWALQGILLRNIVYNSGKLRAGALSVAGRDESVQAVNRQIGFMLQFLECAYGKGVLLEVTLEYMSRNSACWKVLALCKNPDYVRLSGEMMNLGCA